MEVGSLPGEGHARRGPMERNLFRYILVHSRSDQVLIFAIALVSQLFYFISLDLPKTIVNVIQGKGFLSPDSKQRVLGWTFEPPSWLQDFGLPAPEALGEGGALGLPFHPNQAGSVTQAPLEEQPRQADTEQAADDQQSEGKNEGNESLNPVRLHTKPFPVNWLFASSLSQLENPGETCFGPSRCYYTVQ